MKLTERVAADLVAAMKERAELRLSVLRMLKAEFQKAQADKGRASELTDDDTQTLVRRLIKQRREAAEQYRAAGASERADGELAALVAEAAKESGAASMRDMGKLMRVLMPRVAGRADGSRVKERVTAFLA